MFGRNCLDWSNSSIQSKPARTRPIDRHSFALSLCVEEGVIPCNFRAHPSNSQLVNNGLAIRERIQIAVQSVCEDRLEPSLN